VLWDKKQGCIVNNESSEIMRMLNAEFNDLAQQPELDLYPEDLRAKIDKVGGAGWGGGVSCMEWVGLSVCI
jgi:putative glutathione S-transferase